MIERIIDWCAAESVPGVHRHRDPHGVGHLGDDADAARRRAGHLRRAGDRLDRVDGTQPRSHRGSDHLSDRQRVDFDAAGQGRSRLHGLRHLLRLRHLSGRHRHVLGAQPRRRVPAGDSRTAAGRHESGHRARRDRRRLGLRVRAGGRDRPAQPGGSARLSGLAPALLAGVGARRRGGRQHRRVRQAVPGQHRSEQAGGLRDRHQGRHPGDQDEQQRRRGSVAGVLRPRVHGPRARLPDVAGGHRRRVPRRESARHADPRARRRAGAARTGHPARRRRTGRQRRGGRRHRRHALWRERA